MLYHLLFPLSEAFAVLNVFQYITFRSAGAALTALLLSMALGPSFIRWLQRLSVGQSIREEGPEHHQTKAGTPTMGGLLILLAVLVPTLLWADLSNAYVWVVAGTAFCFGAIGFADDYLKVRRKHNQGLTARAKFLLQLVVGLGMGAVLMLSLGFETTLLFPFFKNLVVELGWIYIPFFAFVLVGTSNAVNLTDGLDGLAIGATLIAAATYAILTYIAGNSIAARYLQVAYVPGTGEVAVFCSALVGASLGFLWFNSHPAEVFMGDVGSLALGGGIGAVALLAKQEVLLVIVGGLFVLECLSVILQVASFKLTGKRVLRMAPLHHHFELGGWSESKIIVRFWILSILFALVGLSTLKLR
ncbi:MAG: phospho-N-acetylmuramoyl-pentapeptide-transferase [Acidobacteriota bacterium]